jgi:hypothetical protein
MPRHNRRGGDPTPVASGARSLAEQRMSWRGEEFTVRAVTGSDKTYRCPGCDQEIRAGQPHIVAWPTGRDSAGPASTGDNPSGRAEDRRHWHHPCWTARERRAPGVQRSRSAPRY